MTWMLVLGGIFLLIVVLSAMSGSVGGNAFPPTGRGGSGGRSGTQPHPDPDPDQERREFNQRMNMMYALGVGPFADRSEASQHGGGDEHRHGWDSEAHDHGAFEHQHGHWESHHQERHQDEGGWNWGGDAGSRWGGDNGGRFG